MGTDLMRMNDFNFSTERCSPLFRFFFVLVVLFEYFAKMCILRMNWLALSEAR